MVRFIVIVLLIIASTISVQAQKACFERILEEASRIDTLQSATGTGFLVSDKGYIITNRHVVENSIAVTVTFQVGSNKITREAKVVLWDKFTDVALLKADVSGVFTSALPYGLSKAEMKLGEKIYTLGFPRPNYMGENIKLTDGIISATSGFKDDNELYQISAPIQPGNSGSPLFDSNGNVRGLVVASFSSGQNVNYAIKAKHIANLLEAEKVALPPYLPSNNFNLKLNAIQSRICLIQTVSRKSFFNEFDFIENSFFSKSTSMMHKFSSPCGDSDFEAFIKTGPYEIESKYGTEGQKLFDKIKSNNFASALYYSYWTNYNWNGMDANIKFNIFSSIGAYGNIIKESEQKFSFNTSSIDGSWFSAYVAGFLPTYLNSIVQLYYSSDNKKLLDAIDHIDLLLAILDRFKNSPGSNKSSLPYFIEDFPKDRANLLVFKAWLITILNNKSIPVVCESIKEAQMLNPQVEIWFKFDCK